MPVAIHILTASSHSYFNSLTCSFHALLFPQNGGKKAYDNLKFAQEEDIIAGQGQIDKKTEGLATCNIPQLSMATLGK